MKKVKIVSFQWPDPPDYGGVIDVYFKIQALLKAGVEVELHSFAYYRTTHTPLEKQLANTHIYKRSFPVFPWILGKSYVVESRRNESLQKSVFSSDSPVLLEGLHCSSLIDIHVKKGSRVVLRNHNIEHDYYAQLSKTETSPVKKVYLDLESKRLERHLLSLPRSTSMLSISTMDFDTLSSLGFENNQLVGPFHPFYEFVNLPGKGSYVLYHGNLSVAENAQAAEFIIRELAPEVGFPIMIAGKSPSAHLQGLAEQRKNVNIMSNPSESEMEALISNAQIILLPGSFQSGIKLKLMYSLFRGRHVITSPENLFGTGLADQISVAKSKEEYIHEIYKLYNTEFDTDCQRLRSMNWPAHLSNQENLKQLLRSLFD